MIMALILIYSVCVWLFFSKLKWVKPSPKSIAVAVVIGVIAVGSIVLGWQFSAPYSNRLVASRYAVQIVPQVRGQIDKLNAKPLEPLKQGEDILFEIQKEPYQYAVDQLTAELAASEQNVLHSEAAIRAAAAGVTGTKANLLASKAAMDVAIGTQRINPNAIGKLEVVLVSQKYEAAKAAVDQAQASDEQAQFALKSARDRVRSVQARLSNAKFNLEQCTVRAPSDGFVVNWQVRERTMATSLPFAAIGTFVDTSEIYFVANFGQNTVKNVEPGDPIEFSLKSHPGQIFTGEVEAVIQATGEGQFVTGGQLISAASIGSRGMIVVRFKLDDPDVGQDLAMGTAGSVAIYTSKGKPFHIISKVVVRMQAWMYYLIPM